jgi:Tol biopolymer transport system component
MSIAPPGWLADAGADPELLFKEARRRQRRRHLVAGLAIVVVLVSIAGLAAGLSGPRGHSSLDKGQRRVAHKGESRPAVPASAKQLEGEVAYKCGDYICQMRPDGTGKRTLTATFPEWDAAWSPNGRRLAFRGYYGLGDGDYDLYLVDAKGCQLTRLTHGLNGTNPSWSPTGHQIAFAAAGAVGIDVINANGTGFHHLTTDTSAYEDDFPAWSASNRIAFVRTRTRTSQGEIYTMSGNGSGVAPLTHGGPGFGQPSWSRDGKSIAFVAGPDAAGGPPGTSAVIDVANADGTGTHTVSPSSWTSYNPTWTPGGKIVFLARRGTRISAYIVNADGTGVRELYPSLANLVESVQIAWGSASLAQAGCS